MEASETLTPEARRHYRRVSVLWSGRLDRGPEASGCKILNVSPGGARIRMNDAEPCPAHVTLDCAHFGRVQGKVVWQRHDEMGVAFPMPAAGIAEALGASATLN